MPTFLENIYSWAKPFIQPELANPPSGEQGSTQTESKCPNFDSLKTFPRDFYVDGKKIAEIEDLPLTPATIDIFEMQGLGILETQLPLFLLPNGNIGEYCAYHLNSTEPVNYNVLAAGSVPQKLFGVPTKLESGEMGPLKAVLDDDGNFYIQSKGTKWFSVGNSYSMLAFLSGVSMFVGRMYKNFSDNYFSIMAPLDDLFAWTEHSPKGIPPIYSQSEATTKIELFMDWLSQTDIELWYRIDGLLEYDSMEDTNMTCFGAGDIYAYYEPGSKDSTIPPTHIALAPYSIFHIASGDYSRVASTLRHELAHRDADINGLLTPTDEMFSVAYFLFANDLARNLSAATQLGGFWNRLAKATFCSLYILSPEEEMQAFVGEIAAGLASPVTSRNALLEAFDFYKYLMDVLDDYPRSVQLMAFNYIRFMVNQAVSERTPEFAYAADKLADIFLSRLQQNLSQTSEFTEIARAREYELTDLVETEIHSIP